MREDTVLLNFRSYLESSVNNQSIWTFDQILGKANMSVPYMPLVMRLSAIFFAIFSNFSLFSYYQATSICSLLQLQAFICKLYSKYIFNLYTSCIMITQWREFCVHVLAKFPSKPKHCLIKMIGCGQIFFLGKFTSNRIF